MLPATASLASLLLIYKHHEDVNKCEYGKHVWEVEHGVFTPLVLTSTNGMGWEATVFTNDLLIYLVLIGNIHSIQPFIASVLFVLYLV